MANQEAERGKNEQDVLDQIAGREEEASEPAPAPAKKRSLGWMGYLGCVLWFAVFVAAGALGWVLFVSGA